MSIAVTRTRVCLGALLAFVCSSLASADDRADAQALVSKAETVFSNFLADPNMGWFRDHAGDARGFLIVPEQIKGGFILGGSGGGGVLLGRSQGSGSWSYPAFYNMGSASIGLQIGGQVSEVVFTVMNEDAVEAVLNTQFKLGADLSVAVGPIGKGVEASTTTALGLDLYAFSRTAGLYGGGAFEGAAILRRESLNTEYYGADVGPRQIVIDRKFSNPQADKLRRALPD